MPGFLLHKGSACLMKHLPWFVIEAYPQGIWRLFMGGCYVAQYSTFKLDAAGPLNLPVYFGLRQNPLRNTPVQGLELEKIRCRCS